MRALAVDLATAANGERNLFLSQDSLRVRVREKDIMVPDN